MLPLHTRRNARDREQTSTVTSHMLYEIQSFLT